MQINRYKNIAKKILLYFVVLILFFLFLLNIDKMGEKTVEMITQSFYLFFIVTPIFLLAFGFRAKKDEK